MEVIKYRVAGRTSRYNPATDQVEEVSSPVTVSVPYSEDALEKAKEKAIDGEYTIEECTED